MKCSINVLTRCVAISILLLNVVATSEPIGPVVQTELGVLRGHYVKVKGTDTMVDAYLGVPFAQPPVGPLRLAPPQPAKSWEGMRDATHQPNVCVQDLQVSLDLAKNMSMKLTEIPEVSEDCLYLNIYTPSKSSENSKLPVMVWIHGGGFSMGGVFFYDVSALAAYQNVVVVEIQYRLGILGFFSTGDEHAPGNMGLLDQVQALHWVKEHIHNFGGDSNSVTIFGESAGGVSVSLLLLSPLSSSLVHGAIAESGVALMETLYTRDPLSLAKMMANKTNCDSSSTQTITECVKKLSADDIVKFQKENVMIYFAVTIDGQFLPKSAHEIFQSHEINKAPLMLGANNDEGGYMLANFFSPPDWVDGVDREHMLSILAFFYPDATDPWIAELIADEYLGTSGDRIKIREGYTRMIGDLMFIFPALKTANLHRDAGVPVYFYEFKETVGFLKQRKPSFVGSDHGDELAFVFGICFRESHLTLDWSCTKEEEQLCRTMMQYWGNFAHTRSPNGEGVAHWPLYGPEGDYLSIGMEQVPGQHLRKDRHTFMTKTLPEQIKLHKEKMQQSEKSKAGPVVQIKQGSLRGEYVDVKGKDGVLQAYLGVPFAKPPVGPLRLAPPQPADGWEGVRDATQQPLMCPQDRDLLVKLVSQFASLAIDVPDVSEDCLYLNIYSPAKPAQDAKLPVMVWIHGGGLTSGSASVFDGSALAAYQDVVVVLIQYRLGLLGFLSTGDEHISGNMGLLDQVEALRWVNKNIQMFGGDPNSVTIFGESAGGVSVSLLLLSPLSNGLFHKAIAESGTAAMDLLLIENPLPMAQMAANASGCDITSAQKIADCFKSMTTEDIQIRAKDPTRFPVTVDGHLLTKSVNELFKNQEFLKIPFMTGVNSDEGGWLIPIFFAPPAWADGMDREQVMTPTLAMVFPNPQDEFIRHLVADEYLGASEDRAKIRKGFTELLGDLLFNIPAIKTANVHRDAGAPVYLYEYQHILKSLKEKRPAFVGSDHGDELVMVLGFCFTGKHVKLEVLCTEDEEELSRTMMNYWGNFARTGSPNGEGLAHWPLYGPEGDYLGIGLEQVPGQHLRKDRYAFMTQTLPEQIRLHKEKMEHIEL